MGAGTNFVTKTHDAVIAIATSFAGIGAAPGNAATNIQQGYRRFGDTENWQKSVAALTPKTTAYWASWIKQVQVAENEVYPALIIGELAMALDKDVSDDLNAYWDFAINFAAALSADANYPAGTGKPNRIWFSEGPLLQLKQSRIFIFDFGAHGNGGIEFPDP